MGKNGRGKRTHMPQQGCGINIVSPENTVSKRRHRGRGGRGKRIICDLRSSCGRPKKLKPVAVKIGGKMIKVRSNSKYSAGGWSHRESLKEGKSAKNAGERTSGAG